MFLFTILIRNHIPWKDKRCFIHVQTLRYCMVSFPSFWKLPEKAVYYQKQCKKFKGFEKNRANNNIVWLMLTSLLWAIFQWLRCFEVSFVSVLSFLRPLSPGVYPRAFVKFCFWNGDCTCVTKGHISYSRGPWRHCGSPLWTYSLSLEALVILAIWNNSFLELSNAFVFGFLPD